MKRPKAVTVTELVAETIDVELELRHLERGKLSPGGFLTEAMRIAGTTRKQLETLRLKILGDELDAASERFEQSRRFISRSVDELRRGHIGRPPREARIFSLMTHGQEGRELVAIEAASLGAHIFDLFALAVLIAGEKIPELFGDVDDLAAHDRRIQELRARRVELFAEIQRAYTSDDLLIGEPDRDGRSTVTLKLSGGSVPLGPLEGMAERLLNHILATPDLLKAIRNGKGGH